jgi:hypothetical protein
LHLQHFPALQMQKKQNSQKALSTTLLLDEDFIQKYFKKYKGKTLLLKFGLLGAAIV